MFSLLASHGQGIAGSICFLMIGFMCYGVTRTQAYSSPLRIWAAIGCLLWSLSALWATCIDLSEYGFESYWIPGSLRRLAKFYVSSGINRILLVAIPLWLLVMAPTLMFWLFRVARQEGDDDR